MLAEVAQSPVKSPNSDSNLTINLPKNGRTPLKPKNQLEENKPWQTNISIVDNEYDESNKENACPTFTPTPAGKKKKKRVIEKVETIIDASLAEELSAVKEKLERMRLDKEKTDKLLQDRDRELDLRMTQLLKRGQMQSLLEIEVDRLYRLNQIIRSSSEVSPIRTLREKQQEIGNLKQDKSKEGIREDNKDDVNSGCTTPLHQTSETNDTKEDIKNITSKFDMEKS